MGSLRVALQIHPLDRRQFKRASVDDKIQVVLEGDRSPVIEAEVIDISAHGCRIRIPRELVEFDPRLARIQFAWTELKAKVVWTINTPEYIDLGLVFERFYEESARESAANCE